MWKCKKSKIVKIILKKIKIGGVILLAIKTYKAVVIKTEYTNRPLSKRESPETVPQFYGELIYIRGSTAQQQGKFFIFHNVLGRLNILIMVGMGET